MTNMNSQLVGTNICIDIWKVLSNRPSVLPTTKHPIITEIIQIYFLSDKIHLCNLQKFRGSPTSGKPGLFDNSSPGQFSRKCPQKLRMSENCTFNDRFFHIHYVTLRNCDWLEIYKLITWEITYLSSVILQINYQFWVSACKNYTCSETYFKCPGFYCLPWKYVCDGLYHCPGGMEEQICDRRVCPGYFHCYDSSICIHTNGICDNKKECPYGDDEIFCEFDFPNCHINCTCVLFSLICFHMYTSAI